MQHEEQGRVQLAPRGETTWNHSVSVYEGSLALWWEERDDQVVNWAKSGSYTLWVNDEFIQERAFPF